jgi:hypothetical protein
MFRLAFRSTFESTGLRFAALILFALAALSLPTVSARAFNQGSGGTGEGSNSSFADPDEQVNNLFGFGFDQGPQPSGLGGSAQFGSQSGQLTPSRRFQSNGLTSPPDPLSRPSN